MNGISRKIVRFLLAEDGPTAVEYALALMLIFLVCITAVTLLGQSTANSFQGSNNSIEAAVTPGS